MAISTTNRPYKYGSGDRREFIVKDSEVSYIAVNDSYGNPVICGRAKIGTSLNDSKWQIEKVSYDATQGVTRVTWAEDDGKATGDYIFKWGTVSELEITGISQAATAVVTVSDIGDLAEGDKILILDVEGMEDVNFDGEDFLTVDNIAGNTFELTGVNSTAFDAYTSGGKIIYGDLLNLTFS
jgi:hypothetical protein